MKLKKSLAIILSAVLMLTFLPLFASASGAPTALYVGEKDKSSDNLIKKYNTEGKVEVYSVNKDSSYYTVTYEKGVGYVLTFYNNYKTSEPVERAGVTCGVYCDGDLTIRVSVGATLDMDRKYDDVKPTDAYGIYVKGVLTMEGWGASPAITVCGDKTADEYDNGSIGVYAESLLMHNIVLNVSGGYAAVAVKASIGMINASLFANNTEDMKNAKGEAQFEYGVIAKDFIQVGGSIEVGGDVNIEAYDFHGGKHKFDVDVVVYTRSYTFKDNGQTGDKIYDGLWRSSFDLYVNASLIPDCIHLQREGTVGLVSISGNKANLTKRGAEKLSLVLVCGQASYEMDTYTVVCNIAWWQWIPYILSFAWLSK